MQWGLWNPSYLLIRCNTAAYETSCENKKKHEADTKTWRHAMWQTDEKAAEKNVHFEWRFMIIYLFTSQVSCPPRDRQYSMASSIGCFSILTANQALLSSIWVKSWSCTIMYYMLNFFFNQSLHLTQTIKKGKAVPLQAWSGPEGSRKLRFPDFTTTAQDGGKVVSLTHRRHKEVHLHIYNNWYVSCVDIDWLLAGSCQQPVNINAWHIPTAVYTKYLLMMSSNPARNM